MKDSSSSSYACEKRASSPAREWVIRALLLLWFVLLALVFTRPLIANCKDFIIGEIGDNIYFIWMIGWVQKALFSLHTDPLNVWFLNYPAGWNMASTEMTPSQLALAQPFSLLGDETFAYNMVLLLSFVLSGLIMYGWVRHLSGSRLAGLVSGTIYACLPYWGAHFLIGHLNLCGTQWLPLFFWGWLDIWRGERGELAKKPALLAALGLGLSALTSQYYFFMLVIVGGVMALFMLIFPGKAGSSHASHEWRQDAAATVASDSQNVVDAAARDRQKATGRLTDPQLWKSLGLFVLIALPFLLAAELPFLTLASSGGMPDRDWGGVRMYSAGLTDYLLPSTTHFLFGSWVGANFNRDIWIEGTLYVGIFSLILFIIAIIKGKSLPPKVRRLLLCGVITAVILSMGTDLHWNGSPVELSLPGSLAEKLGRETLPLFLPGFFLFKFFPFYGKLRAMMRFGILALLLIACGAGLGFHALTQKLSQRKASLLAVLCLGLIIFDYFPAAFPQVSKIEVRQVDKWLALQRDEGSVMRYPFYLNDDQAGTYYTLYNEKPFIGGFFNAFPTEQYREISDSMRGFPSEESLLLAQKLGVRYYLIETDELERAIQAGDVPWASLTELQAEAEKLELQLSGTFDDVLVYQLDTEDCDCEWLKEQVLD